MGMIDRQIKKITAGARKIYGAFLKNTEPAPDRMFPSKTLYHRISDMQLSI